MISGSNEQLQQQLEYTLLNLIVTAGEFLFLVIWEW